MTPIWFTRLVRGGWRHRYNCHRQSDSSWEERAAAAAQMLQHHVRPQRGEKVIVNDLGCGNRRLELLLNQAPMSTEYHGYDLQPQHGATMRLDVRCHPLPVGDVSVVLGVAEYLDDINALIRAAAAAAPWLLISFSVMDSPEPLPREEREHRNWRQHLTAQEVDAALIRGGFSVVSEARVSRGRTGLWLARCSER